ncbi:hypothetical protein pb186bvf_021120 [Paramecium bursaria]
MMIISTILIISSYASITDINKQLEKIYQLGTEIDNRQYYIKQVINIVQEINQMGSQVLSSQAIDSVNLALSNEFLQIKTIKASNNYLKQLLYQQQPVVGNAKQLQIVYQTYNLIISNYFGNLYKVYEQYPYPNQNYSFVQTDLVNIIEFNLDQPLQYLFDTGLKYSKDPYNDSNSEDLSDFMQQTQLLKCITGNGTFWAPTCQQQTIIHPNGRVLIECLCYNLSTPITIVNDSDYKFTQLPQISITRVILYRSAVVWVIGIITIVWFIFAIYGVIKDFSTKKKLLRHQQRHKSSKIIQPQPSKYEQVRKMTQSKKVEFKIDEVKIEDTKDNFQIKIEDLQQESKDNSMILKFDDDDIASRKKARKSKLKSQPVLKHQEMINSSENQDISHDQLNSQGDNTERRMMPKGYAKSEYIIEDRINEPDDDDENDDFEDSGTIKSRDQRSPDVLGISIEEVVRPKVGIAKLYSQPKEITFKETLNQQEQQDEIKLKEILKEQQIKNEIDNERDENNEKNEKNEQSQKDNIQHHNEIQDKTDNQKLDIKETTIVIIDKRPLPPINCLIFYDIFMRFHELFSIFYYFKKNHSRCTRFLINYAKTMLFIALCGYLAPMFNLYQNILIMIPGLLLVNGIEQIATILTKMDKITFQIFGYIHILLMLAFDGYVIFLELKDLEPQPHEIWLWTFITLFLSELIIIEFVIISAKVFIQPWLRRNNEKTSPLYQPCFAIFWDKKVQRLIRHQYKAHNQFHH